MLPVSVKDKVAFTPIGYEDVDPPPVYYLRVPTVRDRASLNREIILAGARAVYPGELAEELRDAINRFVEADQKAELIALLDQFVAGDASEEVIKNVAELERQALRYDQGYRNLFADYKHYMGLLPLIAAELFLVGSENAPVEITGRATQDQLRKIPPVDLNAIGTHAFNLMTLDRKTEKNLQSPSPSQPSPQHSTADASLPTTAMDGTSTEPST